MAATPTYKIEFAIKEVDERLGVFIDSSEKTKGSAYHEVKANDTLVTIKIIRTAEEQENFDKKGKELSGDELPSFFTIGEGVTKIIKDNSTCEYMATEPGLVRFSPDSITHLKDKPIIKEDISNQTGNIVFSGDLVCQEHIRSSTKLEIGGNLLIAKTVEDHVKINCKGNLDIGWGANGKSSLIYCQKNCTIGYLENSLLICDGDIDIKTHTMMARIYSRSNVKVQGVGVTSKTRGAVVGGIINALESIQIKSAGAEGCETKLIVGIDLRVETQVKEAQKLYAEMERTILISQQEIETFISAAGKAENLGKMGNKAKALVKEKLLELKAEQKELMKLEGKVNKLKNMLYSKNLKNVYISLQDFLCPISSIQIKDSEEHFKNKVPGMSRYKLVEGKVTKTI